MILLVCPLGDGCLGDGPSCFAAAEALSQRSDESTTRRERTLEFISATAHRCFAPCCDSRTHHPCACSPPIDYTADAQAALLMKLLKHDCVLGMKARAFLSDDEQNLLHAIHNAATIGA